MYRLLAAFALPRTRRARMKKILPAACLALAASAPALAQPARGLPTNFCIGLARISNAF